MSQCQKESKNKTNKAKKTRLDVRFLKTTIAAVISLEYHGMDLKHCGIKKWSLEAL